MPTEERPFDDRLALACAAADALYRAGAQRVWLFGSLGRGQRQDRRSDLDLAVEGLAPHSLREAVPVVRGIARSRVDVIPLETAMPSLRATILRDRALLPRGGVEGAPLPGRAPEEGRFGPTLYQRRLAAVLAELGGAGARRILDLGCGAGRLCEALARDASYEAIVGVDRSSTALEAARLRIRRALTPAQRQRVTFARGLVTHRDPAYLGYDAAAAVELIEHLAEPQRLAFEYVLFGWVRPETVVVTTPNREYNRHWTITTRNGLRHEDHRFEWTRDEFRAWAAEIADRHAYAVNDLPIGTDDPVVGAPTQMATFQRLAKRG